MRNVPHVHAFNHSHAGAVEVAVSHLIRGMLAVPTTSFATFLTKLPLRRSETNFIGSAATAPSVSKSAILTYQFHFQTHADPRDHLCNNPYSIDIMV